MSRKICWQIVVLVLMAFWTGGTLRAGNLVKNGDFTQGGDKPAEWTLVTADQKVTTEKPEGKPGALKVEIAKEVSKSLGEIKQVVKVKKNTKYRLTAEMKSTKVGLGMVMVKPRSSDRKELERVNVGSSKTEWATVTKDFNSGEAVDVQVLCRFNQKADMVGGNCLFTNVVLVELDASGQPVDGVPATNAAEPKKSDKATTEPAVPVEKKE